MSILDRLSAELCPDGVEYKALGEIATITRGSGLAKSDFTESGFPCIHYGQIYTYYGVFATKTKSFVSPELAVRLQTVSKGDIIIAVTSENIEDVCKCVVWLGDEDIVTGGHTAIVKHNQNPKYIAYWLQTATFFEQKRKIAHGTKVIEVTPKHLEGIKIPLPPLPIQNEIVKILDSFAELTEKLTAELTTELTARRKQYEYYSQHLINNQTNAVFYKLRDLGKWRGGGTPSTSNPEFWNDGTIPWLTSKDMGNPCISDTQMHIHEAALGKSPAKMLPKDIVAVVVRSGILRHSLPIVFVPFPTTVNQDIKALVADPSIVIPRYVFYAILANKNDLLLKTRKVGGTVESIEVQKLLDYEIPVPSIDEQKRFIAIFDRFDVLTTDITAGLPAEITARQKQYEYYRDKLLTFRERKMCG